jgi:site-specific DNA-methyltransferase (adenine-specific)
MTIDPADIRAGRLLPGDCFDVLPRVADGSVDCIATDAPFNIGLKYDGYDDDLPDEEFRRRLHVLAGEFRRVIKPAGSVWFFMGPRHQADAFIALRDAGLHHRNSIVWHYTFGPCQKNKFTPSWTMIHYFTAHPSRFTFNADRVRVPSARQLKYADRRANAKGKVPDDTWALLPGDHPELFRPDGDAWLVSRVAGTFKERTGHVTQLPLALVERIVRVATNPGDLVLDPFADDHVEPRCVAAEHLRELDLPVERPNRVCSLPDCRFRLRRPKLKVLRLEVGR